MNDYNQLGRTRSANSFENLRFGPPMPQGQPGYPEVMEAWRTPIPPAVMDPQLTEILRRPPVGLKSGGLNGYPNAQQYAPNPARVQFNDSVRYSEYPPPQQNPYQQPRAPDSYRRKLFFFNHFLIALSKEFYLSFSTSFKSDNRTSICARCTI